MITKQITLAVFLSFGLYFQTKAATVDTVVTHSAAMHKDIKAVVIEPSGYNAAKKIPVIYLLHGFSGNYGDWINKVPAIKDLADQYQVGHTWDYWANSIFYHFLFFSKYFKAAAEKER
ncbi:Putative esterase [Pedobacter westerhofensis]|uniref:Esterase n=1 Tax=Pedobacter westerhofensis TaxID=425512 RepID=A0A521BJI5_9SPHI|nr:alpha/beta hydrolase-fold protein [Pedobacter westerhofensis]SMO46830.1 Putative esterase [Pedobacter westerhofensis]